MDEREKRAEYARRRSQQNAQKMCIRDSGCSMRLDGWEHPAGRGGCGAPRMIYKD